ncbi:MAG: filamentous hemagglutinin N-terminal domain-containing protein [Cyanobacteria bacterium P01_B01_bin.77]
MPSYFHRHKGSIAGHVLFVGRVVAISTALPLTHTFITLASAQVIPDASLGGNPSVIVPESAIRNRIEGGLTNGSNLFHSFQDFNIDTGQAVYFANPGGIETILTRVTGNSPSNVLGILGVLGEADFFLINPNGLLFGSDAQLDIGGSFLATTAAGIQFENEGLFSASTPQTPTMLTVAPSALFFNERAPGQIINRSVAPAGIDAFGGPIFGLRVPDGESLLLAGGEIIIDGSGLNALGGQIDLLGTAGSGKVDIITASDSSLSLNSLTALGRSNVIIQDGAIFDVTADDRGSISITGQNVEILESRLFAGIATGLGTADSQGGDIALRAADDLTIKGSGNPSFLIFNVVWSGATGSGGDLIIEADNVAVEDFAFSVIDSFGRGNAGKTSVQAQETVRLTGGSTLFNNISSSDNVTSGGITVQTGFLELLDGGALVSSVRSGGVGQAGGIRVDAREAVIIDGVGADGEPSGLFATTRQGAVGFSGGVFISANSLDVTRGGRIQSSTAGQGNAGDVTVEIDGDFFLDGANSSESVTGIFTDLDTNGEGGGGDIRVTADNLTLNNGAQFTANTFALGNAGEILVDVQGTVTINGANVEGVTTSSTEGVLVSAPSGLFSNVGEASGSVTVPAFGNGGKITLIADSLFLTNGGKLATTVVNNSIGNAAPIKVTTNEDIVIDGVHPVIGPSEILTEVRAGATGNASDIQLTAASLSISRGALLNASIAGQGVAGEILIDTGDLDIVEGGQVIVTTLGAGDAGDIAIPGGNTITLAGENSGLFANTTAASTGNSGSIFVESEVVTVQDGAQIALDSQGSGRGGSVQLNADSLILRDNGLISAETASNQGGIITLVIDDVLLLRSGSNLSATAGLAETIGDGGNVIIETNFLVAVPEEDSNITANAFLGQGGNVQITAAGIYGIDFQLDEIPIRNDITASSAFGTSGDVNIDTLALEPTRGATELPNATGIPRISQRCNVSQGMSSFIATGRGGVPLGPEDAISPQTLWEELYTPSSQDSASEAYPTLSTDTPAAPLTEAQGWEINPEGDIILTADKNHLSPRRTTISPACSLTD